MTWISLKSCTKISSIENYAVDCQNFLHIRHLSDITLWHKNERKLVENFMNRTSLNLNGPVLNKAGSSSNLNDTNDFSNQLFSAVRTNKTDLSLRLLNSGADPNYINFDRNNNTCLHIAAENNRALQVELLVANGANLYILNNDFKSAENIATDNQHFELAKRLKEMKYFISDFLIKYISGSSNSQNTEKNDKNNQNVQNIIKKPAYTPFLMLNHEKDINFVVNYNLSDQGNILKQFSNGQFSDLVHDVVDYIFFRYLRKICSKLKLKNAQNLSKFLPENPNISKERNLLRTSLTKFESNKLKRLCNDIIIVMASRMNEKVHKLEFPMEILTIEDTELDNKSLKNHQNQGEESKNQNLNQNQTKRQTQRQSQHQSQQQNQIQTENVPPSYNAYYSNSFPAANQASSEFEKFLENELIDLKNVLQEKNVIIAKLENELLNSENERKSLQNRVTELAKINHRNTVALNSSNVEIDRICAIGQSMGLNIGLNAVSPFEKYRRKYKSNV